MPNNNRRRRKTKRRDYHHQYYYNNYDDPVPPPPPPPVPVITEVAEEAYLLFPIPDTRNEKGLYIGPVDFVAPAAGTEYSPDSPGLDVFGVITYADLKFLEFINKTEYCLGEEKEKEKEEEEEEKKKETKPEPQPVKEKGMEEEKPFKLKVKDKYFPLIVISCSGTVSSVFQLSKLKETFEEIRTKHGKTFDLVLDIRDVGSCTSAAINGFKDQMVSKGSDGIAWASRYFSRVCIVQDKTKNKDLSDILFLVAISRVTITDPLIKAIPFKTVGSNKEVETFRAETKPFEIK